MLFMVIERFRNQDARAVYARFRAQGRLAPEGLTYVGSWVEASLDRCFQLMECDDITLLQQWVAGWSDLVSFEIVPVTPGKDTAAALGARNGIEAPPTGRPVGFVVGQASVPDDFDNTGSDQIETMSGSGGPEI